MNMDFATFLTQSQDQSWWLKNTVVCFKGDEYQPLFFTLLFDQLKQRAALPYEKKRLDLATTEKKNVHAMLGQSILGSTVLYWLGDFEKDIPEKQKSDFHTLIKTYQGPHSISFFVRQESKLSLPPHTINVILPQPLTQDMQRHCITFFSPTMLPQKQDVLLQHLLTMTNLQLDTLCMLINYVDLINIKQLPEFTHYLSHITTHQPSLSALAEYFFSLNASLFFQLWTELEKKYSEMFWIAFWTEQLWRAHGVITYLRKNDFVHAKQISYRLPFSFIKTSWKHFTLDELHNLFEQLYILDYRIKTGNASANALSLFFFFYFYTKGHKKNH